MKCENCKSINYNKRKKCWKCGQSLNGSYKKKYFVEYRLSSDFKLDNNIVQNNVNVTTTKFQKKLALLYFLLLFITTTLITFKLFIHATVFVLIIDLFILYKQIVDVNSYYAELRDRRYEFINNINKESFRVTYEMLTLDLTGILLDEKSNKIMISDLLGKNKIFLSYEDVLSCQIEKKKNLDMCKGLSIVIKTKLRDHEIERIELINKRMDENSIEYGVLNSFAEEVKMIFNKMLIENNKLKTEQ